MAKEPWEEDIYDDGEETLKRTVTLNGIKADRLLTILAIIFFVVVVAMVCLFSFSIRTVKLLIMRITR